MFPGLCAWFSVSCDDRIRNLWEIHGGVVTDADTAYFLFSDDASSPDTILLHESEAYAKHELVVFKSEWIEHVIHAGSRHLVSPGPFVLSPREYEPLIGRLLDRLDRHCRKRVAATVSDVRGKPDRDEGLMRFELTHKTKTVTLAEFRRLKYGTADCLDSNTVTCHSDRNTQLNDCQASRHSDADDSNASIPDQSEGATPVVLEQTGRVSDTDAMQSESRPYESINDQETVNDQERVSDQEIVDDQESETVNDQESLRVSDQETVDGQERVSDQETANDQETADDQETANDQEIVSDEEIVSDQERVNDQERVSDQEVVDDQETVNDQERVSDHETVDDQERVCDQETVDGQEIVSDQEIVIDQEVVHDQETVNDQEIANDQEIVSDEEIVSDQETANDQERDNDQEAVNIMHLSGVTHIDSLTLPTGMKMMDFIPSLGGCYVTLK